MPLYQNRIVVIGGSGRFALALKKVKTKYKLYYPSKKYLNILMFDTIKKYFNKIKPKYVIHLAGLSRPMEIHEKFVKKSIDLNVIGTANVVKACYDQRIKLIYFSTSYVYPGKKGNYTEANPIFPINKYAWSKLGGESSVHLYDNSLILRISMTEKPFVHKKAFTNFKTNFIFHESIASILFKLIKKRGIINIGGKSQSVYNFARKFNPKIKKKLSKKTLDTSMNLNKLKKILRN